MTRQSASQDDSDDTKYAFDVEWHDRVTDTLWKYQLFYYTQTREVEMVDAKTRKLFLKRCTISSSRIVPALLRPGAVVTILARQLYIVGFANQYTKARLRPQQERCKQQGKAGQGGYNSIYNPEMMLRTLALVKPDATGHMGPIIECILQSGFLIGEMRMCQLTEEEANAFYSAHRHQPFFDRLIARICSGKVLALELLAKNAVARWRELLGSGRSATAELQGPQSSRACFGYEELQNACHGSDTIDHAHNELSIFFHQPAKGWRPCPSGNSSLCLIKPHAVLGGKLGQIISRISTGFRICAVQTCNLDVSHSAELLELYKRVLAPSQYASMVEEISSGPVLKKRFGTGPSVALEVCALSGDDTVEELRGLCGPPDPGLAKAFHQTSLRAQFGESRALNAVHCTDLAEDAARELAIAFG